MKFTRARELSCVRTSSRFAQHVLAAQSTAMAYWNSIDAGAGEMAQLTPLLLGVGHIGLFGGEEEKKKQKKRTRPSCGKKRGT